MKKEKNENNKNVYIRLQRMNIHEKKKERKKRNENDIGPGTRRSTKTYDAIIIRSQWRVSHLHIVRFDARGQRGRN